jgi:branched-chain amino acid aminotransferase
MRSCGHINREIYWATMQYKFFSHNGVVLPSDQAKVSLSLVEYSYGFGVYETIRYSAGIAYFLGEHCERLMESARIIGLEHPYSVRFVAEAITALVGRVETDACNVKIMLVGASTSAQAQLFILCLNPLFPDRKLYKVGVAVICVELERAYPHAKTLNMLGSYLAYRSAKKAGAYDALLVNRDGNITEGTRTNFFCLRGKTIFTPPAEDILLGVTRKAMLMAAAQHGYEVVSARIGRNNLADYDNAFITSTSTKILPIRAIGDEVVFERPLEPLVRLMSVFNDFISRSGGNLT